MLTVEAFRRVRQNTAGPNSLAGSRQNLLYQIRPLCLLLQWKTTFIFDKSNTVVDSKLVLAPGLVLKSPTVAEIRSDFPDLQIVHAMGNSLEQP